MKRKWHVLRKPVSKTLAEFLNNLENEGHNIFDIITERGYKVVTWKMKEEMTNPITFNVRSSLKDGITNIEDHGYTVDNIKQDDDDFIIAAHKDGSSVKFKFNPRMDKVKEGFIHRGIIS